MIITSTYFAVTALLHILRCFFVIAIITRNTNIKILVGISTTFIIDVAFESAMIAMWFIILTELNKIDKTFIQFWIDN